MAEENLWEACAGTGIRPLRVGSNALEPRWNLPVKRI
jgi:hypothetical protein